MRRVRGITSDADIDLLLQEVLSCGDDRNAVTALAAEDQRLPVCGEDGTDMVPRAVQQHLKDAVQIVQVGQSVLDRFGLPVVGVRLRVHSGGQSFAQAEQNG